MVCEKKRRGREREEKGGGGRKGESMDRNQKLF